MMSQAIYLSSKTTNKPTVIFIQVNKHNQCGWLEKPNGKHIKLCMTNKVASK